MKNFLNHTKHRSAFTLLEVLGAMAIVSILSTLGIAAMRHQQQASESAKLLHQVRSLNSAVQTYELAGGNLEGVTSIQGVLTKLKSHAPASQKEQIAGIREGMIDPRLVAIQMSDSETTSDLPRAIWNAGTNRFTLETSGSNGAREFIVDESASGAADTSARKLSTELATKDQWIWDYMDRSASDTSIANAGGSGSGGIDAIPTEVNPIFVPTTDQLLSPEFSITSGEWNYPDFQNLVLYLTNPNPSGSSLILFSVNNGPWLPYGGAINIRPNQSIRAYARSLDPLSFLDSNAAMENYLMVPLMFSGEASGNFEGATGATGMIADYVNDGGITKFSWGAAAPDQSWLSFAGDSFTNITAGQRFNLGSLNYHNGTIFAGSEAQNVNLSLEINFLNPGITETFGFSFDLNNTINQGISADNDADYVTISNLLSSFQTELNGIQYALQLQFGYDGTDGFATVDQFHVHEGSSATANVYGIFVEISNTADAQDDNNFSDPD